ncbi:MAG: phosphonate ABC transporter, permease protein PhnE [Candidatus Pristimantibacillus lignocellulolyticus]|uniref:Phosphonate ABC transporter, permease protein PhnE n=1 Tax=Candidatus Pristimantibacillus lignocellulolyticus TaxID=2994561 RepID=A0A9J6ZE98_9BACL|nr:MAG: phosphonate ABC transporter, permease protein PhnE [Candidatus Pristimantibacillus lignocellulolyticus]
MQSSKLLTKTITLPNGKVVHERRSLFPLYMMIALVLIYYSIQLTRFNLELLFSRIHQFFVILQDMVPPNWDYISQLMNPLIATIKMSLFGSLLGSICALPLAILAASNINGMKWLSITMKFVLSLLRTLPTLVVALIATFVFGLGTMAGTVAIFLFSIAYVGKLLYEQIENANMGAYEAMHAMGLTTVQSFRYAIFPQVLPNYLSTSLFCFEGNVRYAAILGFVGAGGIGLILKESLGWRNYSNLGMILIMLIATVYIIESISEYFRKKLT